MVEGASDDEGWVAPPMQVRSPMCFLCDHKGHAVPRFSVFVKASWVAVSISKVLSHACTVLLFFFVPCFAARRALHRVVKHPIVCHHLACTITSVPEGCVGDIEDLSPSVPTHADAQRGGRGHPCLKPGAREQGEHTCSGRRRHSRHRRAGTGRCRG